MCASLKRLDRDVTTPRNCGERDVPGGRGDREVDGDRRRSQTAGGGPRQGSGPVARAADRSRATHGRVIRNDADSVAFCTYGPPHEPSVDVECERLPLRERELQARRRDEAPVVPWHAASGSWLTAGITKRAHRVRRARAADVDGGECARIGPRRRSGCRRRSGSRAATAGSERRRWIDVHRALVVEDRLPLAAGAAEREDHAVPDQQDMRDRRHGRRADDRLTPGPTPRSCHARWSRRPRTSTRGR